MERGAQDGLSAPDLRSLRDSGRTYPYRADKTKHGDERGKVAVESHMSRQVQSVVGEAMQHRCGQRVTGQDEQRQDRCEASSRVGHSRCSRQITIGIESRLGRCGMRQRLGWSRQ